MPEVWFRVRWPDDTVTRCYSPSTVVKEHLVPGTRYPLPAFLSRSRDALRAASERVAARYGYACSSAAAQLAEIERLGARHAATPGSSVRVEGFEEG